MIHYQLRCHGSHEFDGWFKDSGAFERQAERGLIACPICTDTNVARALMAPGIRSGGGSQMAAPASEPNPVKSALGGVMPDAMRIALQKLRQEVEKHCDYVGNNFAGEARRIHHGETEPRGIYGESTNAEAEALADEGIDIARIPWIPRTDS